MITTINNNERIFAVWQKGNTENNPVLCNLSQLVDVAGAFSTSVIKHFWNGKLQNISRKEVNTMLSAHGLKHL
jgi:hypothetical protein